MPISAFDTVVVIGHDTPADGGNLFTLMEIRASVSQIPNQDSDGLTALGFQLLEK